MLLAALVMLMQATAAPGTLHDYRSVAAARLPGVPVGNLSDTSQRRAFDEYAKRVCDTTISVRSERRASPAPAGTVVAQDPPAGGRIACKGTVTLIYSTGPIRPEPNSDGGPPPGDFDRPSRRPPIVFGPPTKPRAWLMPYLDTIDAEAHLSLDHRERCRGRALTIEREDQPDRRPAGQLVIQDPKRGTPIECGVKVSVTRSQGPQASSFPIGRLDTPARRSAFEDQAERYCHAPYKVATSERPDRQAPGSYLDQTVPPETIFACSMNVGVTIASALPPPWRMPDFRRTGAEATLALDARMRCGTALPIKRVPGWRTSQLLAQEPAARDEIDCGTSVLLTYAERLPPRPAATPPATTEPASQPPAPPLTSAFPAKKKRVPSVPPVVQPRRPLEMPYFVGFDRAAVDQWISKATRICGKRPAVTTREADSDQTPGTVLTQNFTAYQRIGCTTPISFVVARTLRPPFPWWAAAAIGALAAAGLAVWRLWPTPVPSIVIGTPGAGCLPPAEGFAGTLPVTALEALRSTVTIAVPLLPVDDVEVENG